MNKFQWLYVASAAALNEGKQLALLVSGPRDNKKVVAIGEATTATGSDTAVVNVLQNHDTTRLEYPEVYASYPVTEMCWGMAWAKVIPAIHYLTNPPTMKGQSFPAESWYRDGTKESLSVFFRGATVPNPLALVQNKQRYNKRLLPPDVKTILDKLPTGTYKLAKSYSFEKSLFMNLAYKLVGRTLTRAHPYTGNNIGAVMVEGCRIIGWGVNMKEKNSTYHAETAMIQAYLARTGKKQLPDDCKIYTTLECCHMCSGFITQVGKNVRVYYGLKDPIVTTENTLENKVNGCTQELLSNTPIMHSVHPKRDPKDEPGPLEQAPVGNLKVKDKIGEDLQKGLNQQIKDTQGKDMRATEFVKTKAAGKIFLAAGWTPKATVGMRYDRTANQQGVPVMPPKGKPEFCVLDVEQQCIDLMKLVIGQTIPGYQLPLFPQPNPPKKT
jgi:tRNA(Arg) A34 adenosine deaminase TadA